MAGQNLKDVYLKLLQELLDALSPKQEQLNLTYTKAKVNLEASDGVFYHPKDLKKVKGIGDTIIKRLETKLEAYCVENSIPFPLYREPKNKNNNSVKRTVTALRFGRNDGNPDDQPIKKKRKYIPKQKSGGYAILLGLLELKAIRRSYTKDQTVEAAQKYSSSSMNANFATKEHYGAWASISSLLKHSLVLEDGRPKRYSLTTEGEELAQTLKEADGIKFAYDSNVETNNISLDIENENTADLSELLKLENKIQRYENSSFDASSANMTFEINSSTPRRSNAQSRIPINKYATEDIIDRIPGNDSEKKDRIDKPRANVRLSRKRFAGISYELWTNGLYEIYPIIDHREVKSQQDREFFSNAMKGRGVKMEIRQLSLGDIIWVAKHKETGFQCVLNTIVERKRLDDLVASIKDNRFMEQKNRLEKSGCTNKYYLIEETMAGSVVNMTEALKTSLWIILIYYRFSIIRSSNSNETVEKLHALDSVVQHNYSNKDLLVMFPDNLNDQDDYKKVLKKFQLEFGKRTSIECCHTLDCFQEIMGKNDLRTIGEMTIQVLMYIKGVSLEKAVVIQSVFPTLHQILAAYRKCTSEMDAKLLMFNKLGNAPGNKKISKLLSEKIAEAFT